MSETVAARDAARRLTWQILIALLLGGSFGVLLNWLAPHFPWMQTYIVDGALKLIGGLFRNGLQLLVVPLVFFSLVAGTASLRDPASLGRLGYKTLGLYLLTTLLAVSMALVLASLIQPGSGVERAAEAASYTPPPAPPVLDVFLGMVTRNPIESLATGNMLQIIVFAVLLGIALVMAGEAGERATASVQDWNHVVLQLVTIIMKFAPIGVFALLAKAVAELGADTLIKLSKYVALLAFCLFIQLLVIYPLLLRFVGRISPVPWFLKMRQVWAFAFSTSSSNATIPVTLKVVEQRLGANNRVASFTVPLGATINMDGTAIMQGVATAFIAQLYGVDLSLAQLVTVVGMATLASIGTAGVPSAGMIMLASVLTQVGLPVEGIAIVLSVDRLLDMLRTIVNVSGDAAVTCIVARSEGQLDETVYKAD
ncbi:MAG: dicarboxylate/amino acid:cation symporter [Xanthomonadales bacterium]|nr:dicarboxylate/amino acid:cation symporter [Xanthomonadales bacterium]